MKRRKWPRRSHRVVVRVAKDGIWRKNLGVKNNNNSNEKHHLETWPLYIAGLVGVLFVVCAIILYMPVPSPVNGPGARRLAKRDNNKNSQPEFVHLREWKYGQRPTNTLKCGKEYFFLPFNPPVPCLLRSASGLLEDDIVFIVGTYHTMCEEVGTAGAGGIYLPAFVGYWGCRGRGNWYLEFIYGLSNCPHLNLFCSESS